MALTGIPVIAVRECAIFVTSNNNLLIFLEGSTYIYSDMLSGKAFRYQKEEDPVQPGITVDLKTVRFAKLSLSSAALYRFIICSLFGENGVISFFCATNSFELVAKTNTKRNNETDFIRFAKF